MKQTLTVRSTKVRRVLVVALLSFLAVFAAGQARANVGESDLSARQMQKIHAAQEAGRSQLAPMQAQEEPAGQQSQDGGESSLENDLVDFFRQNYAFLNPELWFRWDRFGSFVGFVEVGPSTQRTKITFYGNEYREVTYSEDLPTPYMTRVKVRSPGTDRKRDWVLLRPSDKAYVGEVEKTLRRAAIEDLRETCEFEFPSIFQNDSVFLVLNHGELVPKGKPAAKVNFSVRTLEDPQPRMEVSADVAVNVFPEQTARDLGIDTDQYLSIDREISCRAFLRRVVVFPDSQTP